MNVSTPTSRNTWFEIKNALQELTLSHSLQITHSNDEIKILKLEKIAAILEQQLSLLSSKEGLSISYTQLVQLLKSKTLLGTKKIFKLKNILEADSNSSSNLLASKKTIIELSKKIEKKYDDIVFSKKVKKELKVTSEELIILTKNFGSVIRHYYSDFIVFNDPWIG